MLYATHLLPSGYFRTKNEMIAVNFVEVFERTGISLKTDRQTDGRLDHVDRQTDEQGEINIHHPNNYVLWGMMN